MSDSYAELGDQFFDAIPSPVYTKDREGRFVTCNRAFCDSMGVEAAAIIGRTAHECWAMPEADLHARSDAALIATEQPQRYQCVVHRADGSLMDVVISKDVLRDQDGAVIGLVGSFVDVSEQKRTEANLRAREEDLRITLDSIGDGVISTDIVGRITRMNPQAERLTGWSVAEALGRPASEVLELVDPRSRKRVGDPVALVIQTGDMVALPPFATLIARDGSERRIADRGAPMRDASGQIVGVVLVFRDVTEQNLLRQQLRHARKLDSVGKIAGGVVHDVNNLLSGVLGAAELMEERLEDEVCARYARMIIDSIEQVGELTGRILRFSRKDDQDPIQTAVDMHAVLLDAAAMLERSLDHHLRLDIHLAASLATVRGDRSGLQSAIINLGVNARDAISGEGRISIVSRDHVIDENEALDLRMDPGPAICIEIADSGSGIDPAVLPYIFEPFFTTKAPGEGTGLGLPSVASTMREHRGAVCVESDADGTRFRCYLPVERAARISTPAPMSYGRCVLVVDDEEIARKTLCAMLSDLGYETIGVASTEAACACLRDDDCVDLAIIDVIMPESDGLDCFRRLRAIDPTLRVLMHSGCAKLTALEGLFAEGLLGFLRKPIAMPDLDQAVGDLLGVAIPR